MQIQRSTDIVRVIGEGFFQTAHIFGSLGTGYTLLAIELPSVDGSVRWVCCISNQFGSFE